ncbi:hypothetical protein RclHR1_14930005 [Rhizophagus clarus]|uniref:Uncharacterized protein n=1 Tax=Rhizophagus clarus TaxID=94130 RepID=A0A2Z6R6F5_9GLOM|nr:hypothetical protein RclHR1_14930005 [Rhizophagus clarus]GES98934.1 hypothetical protein GLOIN_2v1691646 [Rhizophagus clarus]
MTNVLNDVNNEYIEEKNKKISCLPDSWPEVYNPNAWASIFYLVFWLPPWTLFCFVWIFCTGSISVAFSLAFPPLGYFFFIATVASWRSLARIEIITTSFCTNPKNFIIDTIPEITRKAPLYPITKVSSTNPVYPNSIRLGIGFCLNKYTYDCFSYFALYKLLFLLIFIMILPIFIIISLPPFTLYGLPITCTYCSKFGEKLSLDSRNILVPRAQHIVETS